jgi:hypothetical protein
VLRTPPHSLLGTVSRHLSNCPRLQVQLEVGLGLLSPVLGMWVGPAPLWPISLSLGQEDLQRPLEGMHLLGAPVQS